MASGYLYVSPASRAAYLPAYERALLTALHEIAGAIPHQDLSIQWDVCQEVLVFEDYFPHRPPAYKDDVFAMLALLDQERIEAARKVVPRFGIATECGWGRTDRARVPGLLAAHRHVMDDVARG